MLPGILRHAFLMDTGARPGYGLFYNRIGGSDYLTYTIRCLSLSPDYNITVHFTFWYVSSSQERRLIQVLMLVLGPGIFQDMVQPAQ